MRISDWSSDVCSSDLVSTALLNEAQVREGFEIAIKHSRRVVVERHLSGHDHRMLVVGGKVVAVAQRVPAQVIGDGYHNVADLIDIVNQDERRGEGHEKVLTRIRIDERSEEHTSELQSIMRISYAV